jgi:membrane protease YdiL (CAAX protease family)
MGHSFYLQDVALLFLAPMTPPEKVALIFIAVIIAPLFEEILFRGLLFPWVVRRAGLWPAVGLVSLFFAAIHMHLPSLLPLFLLSSFFCLAYARTRSLLVPIGMHAAFNGVTVILLFIMG